MHGALKQKDKMGGGGEIPVIKKKMHFVTIVLMLVLAESTP